MIRKLLLKAAVIAGLLSGAAQADVTGIWDTTALIRTDITAIKSPGLVPSRFVEIYDGPYEFNANGTFVAGDVNGLWKQKKNQYTVTVNRSALEDIYRQSLEQNPGMTVNQVKLVKTKFSGAQLEKTKAPDAAVDLTDHGIWGVESYEYRLDINNNGRREILRVVTTVDIAGYPQQATPAAAPLAAQRSKALATAPRHSPMDAAASAVMTFLNQR